MGAGTAGEPPAEHRSLLIIPRTPSPYTFVRAQRGNPPMPEEALRANCFRVRAG